MMKIRFDRVGFEKSTVSLMIAYYCRQHHHTEGLCEECQGLKDYAFGRIRNCVLLPGKPVCASCHIHCYKPSMREAIRNVMRYSGPRMMLRHPVRGMIYMLIKKKVVNTA